MVFRFGARGRIEIEIVGMEAEKVAGLNYPEYIIVHHSASEKIMQKQSTETTEQ